VSFAASRRKHRLTIFINPAADSIPRGIAPSVYIFNPGKMFD
jgi:hypothetical protein